MLLKAIEMSKHHSATKEIVIECKNFNDIFDLPCVSGIVKDYIYDVNVLVKIGRVGDKRDISLFAFPGDRICCDSEGFWFVKICSVLNIVREYYSSKVPGNFIVNVSHELVRDLGLTLDDIEKIRLVIEERNDISIHKDAYKLWRTVSDIIKYVDKVKSIRNEYC